MIKHPFSEKKLPDAFLPALILLLGALLRLIYLGAVPHGMHQDECITAWNAFAMVHEGIDSAGHRFPIYMADWGDGHSALYVWLTMPLILLNGGHVNALVARLPQAIVAICTLPAVYDLMKRLFNRNIALWSMFLLAICPWHIMISRWGLDANLSPGFLIFGLCFFVRGLENQKYLILSALFYGLTLYSYAVMWPVVPVMLAIQIFYGLYHKKLSINRYSILATVLLFILALPLLLFVLVNSEIIPEITLPFLTIPKMGGYRGGEIAVSLSGMWENIRATLYLLYKQNTGSPYDILLPWGLYYNIGRAFLVVGVLLIVVETIRDLFRKRYSPVFFLFAALVGGGINCLTVTARMHQVDALFIPLLLAQAYAIYRILALLKTKEKELLPKIATAALIAVYLICVILFQRDYYTKYIDTVDAYFAAGVEECVDYALEACEENGLSTITVEQGAQWPRLLFHTEVLPSDYLQSVVYDEKMYPAPASFVYEGITINTRIHYEAINPSSVYIIYYTDVPRFEENYTMTKFYDWYVAVPK